LIQGRNILLIDDVATTLTTLEELAGELKKNGAKSVAALTLAREP
jgi:predicted amidophosphoribosyltransferase